MFDKSHAADVSCLFTDVNDLTDRAHPVQWGWWKLRRGALRCSIIAQRKPLPTCKPLRRGWTIDPPDTEAEAWCLDDFRWAGVALMSTPSTRRVLCTLLLTRVFVDENAWRNS